MANALLKISSNLLDGAKIKEILCVDDLTIKGGDARCVCTYETESKVSLSNRAYNRLENHIKHIQDEFGSKFLELNGKVNSIIIWFPDKKDDLYNLMLPVASMDYLSKMGISLQAPYFAD